MYRKKLFIFFPFFPFFQIIHVGIVVKEIVLKPVVNGFIDCVHIKELSNVIVIQGYIVLFAVVIMVDVDFPEHVVAVVVEVPVDFVQMFLAVPHNVCFSGAIILHLHVVI